ncbi:TonB-dependent receptor, partial [Zobellia galactanivorans]
LNFSAAANIEIIEDMDIDYSYQAFFGRINLDLNDTYIFNLTGRRDGSSRFGPGKQFGNFGAVGLAWLFSNENFLKDNSFFNYGKIRGSYGTTGSDNIGDYEFLNTYSVSGFDYNGIATLRPTRLFNPDFGWEVNKKLEFALELGFFRDRILLNTVWFQNRSSNQLIGIPLATTTGFNSLTGNFNATVENTGFEVDFRATLIQRNNFRWITNFNITLPKNRLLEFPGLETSAFANRYRIGHPLTVVRLYHALGVDPETGVYQFEDYNKDGVINSLEDRQWTEDLAPKYFGGLGNTLSYKNLNLDVFLQFKNQKAFNYLSQQATPGYRKNAPVTLVNRWQQPGDDQPVQIASGGFGGGIDTGQLQGNSNAAVSDASFIRLRNIALTYKIPQKSSKALDVSIYLQGQNLFTITEYDGPDPEQSSYLILPPLRQLTLGLQLGF